MMSRRREQEIERKERKAARDERESAAGKLRDKVPNLTHLDITVRETRPEGWVTDTSYIRRVVLEQAPALFEIPCSDTRCEDGGYDMTREILASLSAGRVEFDGEAACRGRCGAIDCGRRLAYSAKAKYGASAQ